MNEKLTQAINIMTFHAPYYSEILLGCIFVENEEIKTAGVRATRKGFEFAYAPSFLDELNQEQVNYLVIHECQHILSSHMQRAKDAQLNPKLSNIAADMIINNNIESFAEKDKLDNLVERPTKDILIVPDEYKDEKIMEYLYAWLIDNSKTEENEDGSYSFDGDSSFDEHPEDEVSPDIRNAMVNDVIDTIRRRGFSTANFESQLLELRRPSINYLNKIKSAIANAIGKNKKKTWFKPSRRSELSKGIKKEKSAINVLLDTSGSMGGSFEHVLSYIFHNGIEINLIQCDTEIKDVRKIKSKNELKKLTIKGMGGTEMSKAIDYIVTNLNSYPTIFLTDGFVGSMDLTGIKEDFMILYTEEKVPLTAGKAKQFKIKRK